MAQTLSERRMTMKMFLGILLGILGLAAIVTMFMNFGANVTLFWRIAHFVAGAVLIIAAVPMIRDSYMSTHSDSTGTMRYNTPKM